MPGAGALVVVIWLLTRAVRGAAPAPTPASRATTDVPFGTILRVLAGIGAAVMATFILARVRAWGRSAEHELPIDLAAASLLLASIAWPESWIGSVLVPLGATRAAGWLERTLSTPDTYHERDGAGLLAAARAAARRPSARRLAHARGLVDRAWELGSRGAAAHALLLAAEGRLDDARALFELVTDTHFLEPQTMRFARDWLAADAAARGDWGAVERAGGPGAGRLARLLAALASFEAPGSLGDRWRLRLRWLLAPHRRRTWPLLARALGPGIRRAPSEAFAPASPLDAHRHLLVLAPHEVRLRDVRAAVAAIEALSTSTELLARLARRGLALGTSADAERLRSSWCRSLEADVADVVASTDLSLEDLEGSATKERLLDAIRDRRRAALQALADDVHARSVARRDLPAVEEWMAWSRIARALRRAESSASDAELAVLHRIVYPAVTNWAVRLCNIRGLRWLASHVFEVGGALAARAHDAGAAAQLRSNVRGCSAAHLPRRALPEDAILGDEQGHRRAHVASFLTLAAIVPLGLGMAVWLGRSPLVPLVFACIGVALLLPTRVKYVEAALTDDGVLIQDARGAFYAAIEDVVAVPIASRIVWLRLRRRPRWVSNGVLVTFSVAPELTRSVLSELRARTESLARATSVSDGSVRPLA